MMMMIRAPITSGIAVRNALSAFESDRKTASPQLVTVVTGIGLTSIARIVAPEGGFASVPVPATLADGSQTDLGEIVRRDHGLSTHAERIAGRHQPPRRNVRT